MCVCTARKADKIRKFIAFTGGDITFWDYNIITCEHKDQIPHCKQNLYHKMQ